jgi:hypothetical protein
MTRAEKLLGLGLAVSLLLTAALVLAGQRKGGEPLAQRSAPGEGAVPARAAQPDLALDESSAAVRSRAVSEFAADEAPLVDAEQRRAARKREAGFLAEFLALRTEQGAEVLERSVREVLSSSREPAARKSAGLRALHEAGASGLDALLAVAVLEQSDVAEGASLSVPRSALKLLFERAPTSADARCELARLAFVQELHLSPALRSRASTALAASIHGLRHDEAASLLRLSTSGAELEAALQVLARDPNFGAVGSAPRAQDP